MPNRGRRNIGPPVRLEDDEGYLNGDRQRGPTKPAYPELSAQSTVPYDSTLPAVPWKTRPLDQPFLQQTTRAPIPSTPTEPQDDDLEFEAEDFSKCLTFESSASLDVSTSESESENSDECEKLPLGIQDEMPFRLLWSNLSPALQLSIYETVYSAKKKAYKHANVGKAISEKGLREKTGAILALSSHELIEIEAQRSFRVREPLTEEYLRDLWLNDEISTLLRKDLFMKRSAREAEFWPDVNDKYMALMLHIKKYKYARKREIELAKAYLKTRGLKPKVTGQWKENDKENNMVLISTDLGHSASPLNLPITHPLTIPLLPENLLAAATVLRSKVTKSTEELSTNVSQTISPPNCVPVPGAIASIEDFMLEHDPKISLISIPARGRQEDGVPIELAPLLSVLQPASDPIPEEGRRDHQPDRAADIFLNIAASGLADVCRGGSSKRPASSELRSSYPNEDLDTEQGARDRLLNGVTILDDIPVGTINQPSSTGSIAQQKYLTGARLVIVENGRVEVDFDARPTPEVASFLQTGIVAGRRPTVKSLSTKLEGSRNVPPAASNVRSDRPGGLQYQFMGIDSDHMSASDGEARRIRPPLPKSSLPQSEWPPIESSNASLAPNLTRSATRVPAQTKNTPLQLSYEEAKMKEYAEDSTESDYPSLPFGVNKNAGETESDQEASSPCRAAGSRRALSAPILLPDAINDDYDSGLGTSRATSTEMDNPKRGHTTLRNKTTPQDETKNTRQTAQPSRKTGKGSRGGPEAYKTKRNKGQETAIAAFLIENTDART